MARYAREYVGERRTEHVGFYVTPTERATLVSTAQRHGATLSEFARELLLRRSAVAHAFTDRRRNPEAHAIMRALQEATRDHPNIGNNLNQIARYLNTTGELRDREELRKALALYEQLNEKITEAVKRILDSIGM